MRTLLLLLIGCGSEPGPVELWHGAIRIDQVLSAEATCAPGGAPTDPVEPFLFLAALDGEPPLSSLYWCRDPEQCPPGPFATVRVDRLTPRELEGEQGQAALIGQTCEALWDRVEASQEGDRVTVVWRTFRGEVDVASDAECDGFLDSVMGEECDHVLTIEGVRAP